MKKTFAFVLALLLCVGLFTPAAAFAQSSQELAESYPSYELFSRFIEANPSRVAGSEGEKNAAKWIFDFFEDLGYDVSNQPPSFPCSGGTSSNVTARMDNKSDYDVIIGAHYDCVAAGEGADDNASGVAALLLTASALKEYENLPYNIIFVAFGAEEEGLLGSTYYVSQMSQSEKDATAMMINFDSIGMGDFLYIYGEDVKTDYINTFLSTAKDFSSQKGFSQKVFAKPINKDIIMDIAFDFPTAYPYFQTAQASDHSPFRATGVPTTFFFSGNYDTSVLGYVQSSNAAYNIMHTQNDNEEYIRQNRGIDFAQKIEIVSSTVVNVLTNNAFENIIISAREELVPSFWLSIWPAAITVFLLVAAVIIFSVFYLKKLNKRSATEDVEAKIEKVFKEPTGEDIYDFLK